MRIDKLSIIKPKDIIPEILTRTIIKTSIPASIQAPKATEQTTLIR